MLSIDSITCGKFLLSMDNEQEFRDWLLDQLTRRAWRQADLARESGLASSVVSNIINGKRRVGKTTLLAISRALRLPPEAVFEKAGILPPKKIKDPWLEDMMQRISSFNGIRRRMLERFVHSLEGDDEDIDRDDPAVIL